jgi:hypothetical protein
MEIPVWVVDRTPINIGYSPPMKLMAGGSEVLKREIASLPSSRALPKASHWEILDLKRIPGLPQRDRRVGARNDGALFSTTPKKSPRPVILILRIRNGSTPLTVRPSDSLKGVWLLVYNKAGQCPALCKQIRRILISCFPSRVLRGPF